MVRASGLLGFCAVLVCLATQVQAQDTETPLRDDPFSLEGISEVVPEVVMSAPSAGFRPAEVLPKRMPGMVLRGIGRMSDQDQPTALIEIGKFGLFIVTENDTISLQGLPGDNVLRIVKITEISVTVEAGSFGELIIIR